MRILQLMADLPSDHGFSCTLDGPAFRIREDEFREIFARSLRDVEELDTRSARLLFDADCEAELRELLTRETHCCSFFEFEIRGGGKFLALVVRVPSGSEAALAFLLRLTPIAR